MNERRRMTGFVTSDKMMKTVVVEVTRTYNHPLYKKVVHASNRFKAHDELGAKVGDEVVIVESRPISRDKHWVVESIVRPLSAKVDVVAASAAVAEEVAEFVAAEEAVAEEPVAEAAVAEDAVAEAAVDEAPVDEEAPADTKADAGEEE
jgi:small subunit ribosomal protein S17